MILFLQLNDHRNPVRQHGAGNIGDVAWLGDQHLVSWV